MSLAETYPSQVRLTADGVEELERWLGEPDRPTENLPVPANTVFNIITVHGDLQGSPLVQGSPGATVTSTYSTQSPQLSAFAEGYRRLHGQLDLDGEGLETLEADLATVDNQAAANEPDGRRWRPSLRRLMAALGTAAAAGVTSGAHDEDLPIGHQLLSSLPGAL